MAAPGAVTEWDSSGKPITAPPPGGAAEWDASGKPITSSASTEPDYSHPAGLGGQTAPSVARPAVNMHEAHGILSGLSNPGALDENNSSITPKTAMQSSPIPQTHLPNVGAAVSDLKDQLIHPIRHVAQELNQHATDHTTYTATGPTNPTSGDWAKFGANLVGNAAGLVEGGERPDIDLVNSAGKGLSSVGEGLQNKAESIGKYTGGVAGAGAGAGVGHLIGGNVGAETGALIGTQLAKPAGAAVQAGVGAVGRGLQKLGDGVQRTPVRPNYGGPNPVEPTIIPPNPKGLPYPSGEPGPEDIEGGPLIHVGAGSTVTPPPPQGLRGLLPAEAGQTNEIEPLVRAPQPQLNENTARTRVDPNTGIRPTSQQALSDQPGYVAPTSGRTLIVGPNGEITPKPYELGSGQNGGSLPAQASSANVVDPLVRTQTKPTNQQVLSDYPGFTPQRSGDLVQTEAAPHTHQFGVSQPTPQRDMEDLIDTRGLQQEMREGFDNNEQANNELGRILQYAGNKPDIGKTTQEMYGQNLPAGRAQDLIQMHQPWGGIFNEPQDGARASLGNPQSQTNFRNPFVQKGDPKQVEETVLPGDYSLAAPTSFYHGSNQNLIRTGISPRIPFGVEEVAGNQESRFDRGPDPNNYRGVYLADSPNTAETFGPNIHQINLPARTRLSQDPDMPESSFISSKVGPSKISKNLIDTGKPTADSIMGSGVGLGKAFSRVNDLRSKYPTESDINLRAMSIQSSFPGIRWSEALKLVPMIIKSTK